MAEGGDWTQIPSILLDTGGKAEQANQWVQDQRGKLADTWAAAQKNIISQMQQAWQNDAAKVIGSQQNPDDLAKLSPDAASNPLPESKVLPQNNTSSPNPGDILSGTAPSTFDS